jgi:translation elongation factor aEF-1 beta
MFCPRIISRSSSAHPALALRLSAAKLAEERALFTFVLAGSRGLDMGQVALTMNVMLESPETNAEDVKKKIQHAVSPDTMNVKPVAFGLKMIEVLLVFDDKTGANTDAIEEKLRSIEGVSSVEAGEITLI